jgi:hypothetical protein
METSISPTFTENRRDWADWMIELMLFLKANSRMITMMGQSREATALSRSGMNSITGIP